MSSPRPSCHRWHPRSFGWWLVFMVAAGCRDATEPAPADVPLAAPEVATLRPSRPSEATLTAELTARGYLPFDPLALIQSAAELVEEAGAAAVRPVEGTLALARMDLAVPCGPGQPDLILLRTFRHHPELAADSRHADWDLHHGFGPASPLCREGAVCDAEGHVTRFTHAERVFVVGWRNGHPVNIRDDAVELVRWTWKGDQLVSLSAPQLGRSVTFVSDGSNRITATEGSQQETWNRNEAGRLMSFGPKGQAPELLHHIAWSDDGRVAGVSGPLGTTRFERTTQADGTTIVRVMREGQLVSSHAITTASDGRSIVTRDAEGRLRTTRRFDRTGRLVESTTVAGTFRAEWGEDGRLVRVARESGVTMRLERAVDGAPVAFETTGGSLKQRVELGWKDDRLVSVSRDGVVVERRTYGQHGAVASITGADGLTWTFKRDAQGRIAAVTGSNGTRESFERDGRGRIVARVRTDTASDGTPAQPERATFVWDEASRLVETRHADGTVERWEWDANDRLLAHVDGSGRRVAHGYDVFGRLTSIDGSDGVSLRLTHGPGGRPHEVTRLRRDGERLEPFATTRYQWTPDGKASAVTGPDGIEERLTWDSADRLVARHRGEVPVWRAAWQGALLVEEEDADGRVIRFSYDDLGRPSRIAARPDRHRRAHVVDVAHEANGQVVLTARDTGVRQTLAPVGASPFGSQTIPVLTAALGPSGQAVTWTHDARGHVATETTAGGDTVRFERDSAARPRRIISNLSGAVNLGWDGADRLTSLTDDFGHSRVLGWDGAGRLAHVAVGSGRWQYRYDDHGRLVALIDASGRTRHFAYGAGLQPTAIDEAWPDGRTRFERDAMGRVVLTFAADGAEIQTTWSDFRPAGLKAGSDTLTWTWDGAFPMAEDGMSSNGPTHAFRWSTENDGHVLVEHDTLRNTTARTELDAHGRVVAEAITLPDGQEHRIERGYRNDGLLASIAAKGFGTIRFDHDTLGRRAAMHLPEGGIVRWQYDAGGRVAAIVVSQKDSAGTWEASFTRDALGRLAAASVGGDTLTWGYDRDRRLGNTSWTRAGETRVMAHGYDTSGLLTTIAGQPIERDAGGRVVSVGGARRAWDVRGRMTGREDADGRPVALAWDGLGRLVGAEGAFGHVRWTVDGRGRLLARSRDGRPWHFHWNGLRLLAESDDQKTSVLHVPGEGPRERLAMRRGDDTWFIVAHPDGSTLALVDGRGHIIEAVLHTPHGALLNRARALDAWHWRGHFTDPEVGIVHHGERWLDPVAGVFMSPDAEQGDLMMPETLNRFEYLEGDPVNRHDPAGAAGFEWELGKQTLEGVCDLFQKGKVEAGYGFGKALDGFSYQGAIERRGWVYDVWSKRVPGTDKVVTYIRDLNEQSHGYYGKPNITGNIVLQPTQPVTTTAVQQTTTTSTSTGVVQNVRDFMTQVKHGLQLHGREIAGTVAGLGGVSGTLATPVSVLASLPGGMTIIGIAGAAAAALGYGTGTLVNQLPGVQSMAQGLLSKLFGLEQDQALANLAAAEKNEGEATKEGRRRKVQQQLDERERDGLPHEPGEPGVAGGTIGLEPPPANDDDDDDDDDEGDEAEQESDETVADLPKPSPGILDVVTPVRVSFTWRQETDASAGEFRNTIICSGRATFWNVGALAPGYEKVEWVGECTTTMSGGKDPIRGSGTFSGGPDGTLKVVNAGETISIPIVGGRVAVVPEVGECALSPANAFAGWPAKVP